MANDKLDELTRLDDDLARVKTGVEAAKEWGNVAWRLADALEHQAITEALGQLMLLGLEVDPTALEGIQHRKDCPVCVMMRTAKPGTGVVKPGRIIR